MMNTNLKKWVAKCVASEVNDNADIYIIKSGVCLFVDTRMYKCN